MVKYEIIDLPIISIIGKEGLCTKEKNVVQDLWQQANSNFSDIADLGMKNADGSFDKFIHFLISPLIITATALLGGIPHDNMFTR